MSNNEASPYLAIEEDFYHHIEEPSVLLRDRLANSRAGQIAARCLIAAGVIAGSATLEATPAQADSGLVYTVVNPDNDGTYGIYDRNSPQWSDSNRELPDFAHYGDRLRLICGTDGDSVGPYANRRWHLARNLTHPEAGVTYIPDRYLDTENRANQATPGEPECAGVAATMPSGVVSSPEVHVNQGSESAKTDAFLELVPEIEKAAAYAGIDGQTLARVIYHEGGNYLPNVPGWDAAEIAGSGSVGIGQIQIATAKLVDLYVYHDYGMATEDDIIVRSRLIYDKPYAIRTAAGYLRMMQDAGLTPGWPQFMAYNLSVDMAKLWKATGHSMDRQVLASLHVGDQTIILDVFEKRQQYYNDAKNAIG